MKTAFLGWPEADKAIIYDAKLLAGGAQYGFAPHACSPTGSRPQASPKRAMWMTSRCAPRTTCGGNFSYHDDRRSLVNHAGPVALTIASHPSSDQWEGVCMRYQISI